VLSELRVRELGVIEDLSLVFGAGMTAVTGETGAGKTLVVEAIELLVGGRAEGLRVRGGAGEAVVEGRFTLPAPSVDEVVVSRVVPADGRSRAYVDGRMATVGALAELGARLVDLHGQHSHQSLFSGPAQREALDSFAGVDRRPRELANDELRRLEALVAQAGGDARGRQRELDLLRYQLSELEAAKLAGPGEDEALALEEERLSRATAHRDAAQAAYAGLIDEDQVLDRLGRVVAELGGHQPLSDLRERLRGLTVELEDAAAEARETAESLEDDPQRLEEVVSRRALLREFRRKYAGPGGGLEEVLAFCTQARQRLEYLEAGEQRAGQLERERREASAALREACEEMGRQRREAAASLGGAVQDELRRLAMPRARFEVRVGVGPEPRGDGAGEGAGDRGLDDHGVARNGDLAGDDVVFLLAANPGEEPLPLAKVASGGELARTMLALRLVLSGLSGLGPPSTDNEPARTLVFDEVDAGIGGEAALAVGRALASLAARHQVVLVTHLAQVAAFADYQIAVSKTERDGRSVAVAQALDANDRVVELSRMLSGQPGSQTARRHAEELLESVRSRR
jgi:DNA repair protein RecN (Recombination protein N)